MTKLPAVSSQPIAFTTKTIPLDQIAESATNPRKAFDDDKLKELALSITANGVLQAPGVRPQKAGGMPVPNRYVLIWGARRLRAAALAKLTQVEVRIYDVDDVKAAELQLIENDDREDLTPLERAEGYLQLHKKHGLSVEQIAAEVKKSRSWVYQTMKLLELQPAAKKALLAKENALSPSHAAELVGLPLEFQAEALEAALGELHGDGPMSLSAFKDWIHSEFMLDLAKAPFDTESATLLPKAGACSACPKRTGFGQMDLLAGKKTADLCKDKPCHGLKTDAHLALQAKAGKKVLSADEVEEIFPHENSDYMSHRSTYVRADSKDHGAKKTFGELVAPEEKVFAKLPGSNEVVELVPKRALPKAERPETHARQKDPEDAKREREHKERSAIQVAIVNEMSRSKEVEGASDTFFRALACGIGRSVQSEPSKQFCKRLGLEPEPGDDFREMAQEFIATLSGAQLRRVVLQLAYADSVPDFMYSGGLDETILEGAKMLRIDAKKVEASVRKELADERKSKVDSKKAGEQLAAKIANVKKSKLTPHQQAALIAKMKDAAGAKPVVEKVPTKKAAKKSKGGGGQPTLEARSEEGWS